MATQSDPTEHGSTLSGYSKQDSANPAAADPKHGSHANSADGEDDSEIASSSAAYAVRGNQLALQPAKHHEPSLPFARPHSAGEPEDGTQFAFAKATRQPLDYIGKRKLGPASQGQAGDQIAVTHVDLTEGKSSSQHAFTNHADLAVE